MELRSLKDPLQAAQQLRMLELEKKRIALSRSKCTEAVLDFVSTLQQRLEEDKAHLLDQLEQMCSSEDQEEKEKFQFQPNPLLEQLLNGKLGCLTTSPLLPNQLRLDVGNLALRPGATISCSVVAIERQVLPVATLECLEVEAKVGEVKVVVEKQVVGEGSCLLLTFKAVAKGCYKISARVSSHDVLGSPLNLPVLENTVAALAKLGLKPLPDTGSNSKSKLNVDLNKPTAVDPLPESEDSVDNFLQVGKTSKLTTVKLETTSKPPVSQTSKPEISRRKSIASQARGEHCFVEHEGEWHAGVLHAVIHETLVTVRNLSLDQYRGVHPNQVVFEAVDLPEGRKLAPSALDLLKKKAEEKLTEPKSTGPKNVVDEKPKANETNDMAALIQEAPKVTLGRRTDATVALEQRAVRESKPQPDEEEKLEEDLEETKATEAAKTALKEERKDGKQWQKGEECVARWEEDKVWYRARVVDTLQDQGDYLVFFTDYLNEAVVGREEMVESVHEIPHGEAVDEMLEMEPLPSHDFAQVKVEVEGQNIPEVLLTKPKDFEKVGEPEVLLTRPKVGEECVAQWSDMIWYRASVDEVQEDGAIVLFTDYGNSDFVMWDLIELNASCIPLEATKDPNLPLGKSLAFTDCKLLSLRLRLEIGKPLSVAVVESSGEVLVLTESEVRRYSRQGVFISSFCSHLDQPTDLLLLKSGQVIVREAKGLKLFSPDGQFVRSLGSQTDCSVGLAEDQNGLLVTINCNKGGEEVKVTEAGETDIFFINTEKDTVLKRIEMKYCLPEDDDDAVLSKMRLTQIHQHGDHLLAVDEGNHRVFLFHQEDGEDVVEIQSDFQFKAPEVVVDSDGNYLILDRVQRCLQVVEAGWIKGSTLQLDMPLAKPSSLALDRARSELWLADFENNQLACFSAGHV